MALLLSGSHATREAVWASVAGNDVSLSDLDLYAVMRDEDACKTARTRARARRASGRAIRCDALAGPLEIAFVTREGLAAMPARPGTVDLARQGRVLHGDAGVLDALPRWTPAAIPAEERLLLLENRAFELLWALSCASEGLPALRARHAVLKTALDLALVRALAQGDATQGAAARVAAARALGAPAGVPAWLVGAWDALSPVWDEALAWRVPGARVTRTEPLMPTWRTVVRAWCAVWWREACVGMRPEAPFARAAYAARRGSFARRVRRSLAFRAADGASPSLGARLLRASHGTPTLRIHGSATTLLLAAASTSQALPMTDDAIRALRALGVTHATRFEDAARDVVRAWDRQLHEGLRTGGAA